MEWILKSNTELVNLSSGTSIRLVDGYKIYLKTSNDTVIILFVGKTNEEGSKAFQKIISHVGCFTLKDDWQSH